MKKSILVYTQGWVLCSTIAFLFSDTIWFLLPMGATGFLGFYKELLIVLLYLFVYSSFTLIINNFFLDMLPGMLRKKPKQQLALGGGVFFLDLCCFVYTTYLNYLAQENTDMQRFWFTLILSLAITSVFTFVYSFGVLVEEIRVNEKMTISILKSQLKPHFVFNSLNTLTYLISEDSQKAEDYTVLLSKIFRYQIENLESDYTPITKAVEEAEYLIRLYLIRYPNGICLEIQPQLYHQKGAVLSMSFQVLLENIIKHNEISSEDPVIISIFREGNFISVTNSISERRSDKIKSFGIGLKNLKQRYHILTNKVPVITKENNTFKVQLPIIN